MLIPFLSFAHINTAIRSDILKSFEAFFDKGEYILGSKVKEFELQYAKFNQTNYAVGVSNGLDALNIALTSLGIGEDDEVIVPANTYIATLLAVSFVRAKPILVEPDHLTCNIDIDKIEKVISKNTKAIIPVHLYGHSCDMESIMSIAKKYKLFVIEDNAQSHGASWKGKLTGSWGHINATSFYPGKNLGALGDAGAITTDDPSLANKAKMLSNYGSEKKYYNKIIGYNMRMDECQASFLSVKLSFLNKWTNERQAIASLYNDGLKNVGDLILPVITKMATHVFHLYVVRTQNRNALKQYLFDKGIITLIHYPIPPHLQEAYKKLGYKKGDFPITEMLSDTCLSLPIWPGMSSEQVIYVIKVIKTFFNE